MFFFSPRQLCEGAFELLRGAGFIFSARSGHVLAARRNTPQRLESSDRQDAMPGDRFGLVSLALEVFLTLWTKKIRNRKGMFRPGSGLIQSPYREVGGQQARA